MSPELALPNLSPATSPVHASRSLTRSIRPPTPSTQFEPLTLGLDRLLWPTQSGAMDRSPSPATRLSQEVRGLQGPAPKPCLDTFERLARESPLDLLAMMQGSVLTSPQLSFAAEAAGLITDSSLVMRFLMSLAESHPSAPVREGAVYGLERHLDHSDEARSMLRAVAEADVSPAVRSAARDALALG